MLSFSEIALVVAATGVVLGVLALFFMGGGDTKHIGLACRLFFKALRDRAFAKQAAVLLTPPTPEDGRPSAEALRVLSLLQREGRLVDFLMEDIGGASRDQIAAAVNNIHSNCQAALKKHLELVPVLPQPEGETVEIPAGFDASAIRLVGNVSGQPPFRGMLRHSGWRVRQITFPPLPEDHDTTVLMPAEVEIA